MKNIKIALAGILCLTFSMSQAQSTDNALLFSKKELLGTARYVGMGGAFAAFGANQSAISDNPAGGSLYRRGDFSISFGIGSLGTSSEYMGNTVIDDNSSFRLDNLGIVFTSPGTDGMVSSYFGIAYNKTADFNENYVISGDVNGTTLLDVFSSQANGTFEDDLASKFPASAGLAYNTYLINPSGGGNTYDNEIPFGNATQTKRFEQIGRSGETVLSGGANIDNKVFVGGSLGITSVNMEQHYTYVEDNLSADLELDEFEFKEDVTELGTGINLKGGIIVQAQDWLRLGAAIHSPNWTSITGTFSREMSSSFVDYSEYYSDESGEITYDYKLRTPVQFHFNSGVIVGKKALIGADYSFINYNSMKIGNTANPIFDSNYNAQNQAIKDTYKGAHNLRVGAELRLAEYYYVRGGVNFQQSPFEQGVTQSQGDIVTYSTGAGIKIKAFYLDAAFSYANEQQDHYLYSSSEIEAATIDKNISQIAITVGSRF